MNWTDYFMAGAKWAASKSKDETQVGCLIVGPNREIRATGFNGLPIGVNEAQYRKQRPTKYLFTSHAEENAVAFAARNGATLDGCTAYVTHHPCSRCARSLIQAGVRKVIFGAGTTSMPKEEFDAAREMFIEAGVTLFACT